MSKEVQKKVEALQLELKQVTRGYSVLNENQVQKLFNSTPGRWTFAREGRGGNNWKYVKRGYVRKQLDSIFGFNHSFETKTSVLEALQVAEKTGSVVVEGRLTCVVLDSRGQEMARLIKDDYGTSLVKFKTETKNGVKQTKKREDGSPELLDFGNDLKAAKSDCFKRCAASLGIAADIYEKDEFFEIEIVGSDSEQAGDKQKNTQKLINKAKKDLNKPAEAVNE